MPGIIAKPGTPRSDLLDTDGPLGGGEFNDLIAICEAEFQDGRRQHVLRRIHLEERIGHDMPILGGEMHDGHTALLDERSVSQYPVHVIDALLLVEIRIHFASLVL